MFLQEFGAGSISPANSGTGHGGNDAGPSATQEALPAKLPLNDGRRVEQTLGRADFLVLRQTPSLQQRLHHVERGGQTGRKGTRQTTGHTVRERVVILRRVHDLGNGLVGDKLSGGEGDSHAEGSGIGDIECLETFRAVNRPGTLKETLVYRTMHLHTLLDHCAESEAALRSRAVAQKLTVKGIHQGIASDSRRSTAQS